MTTHGGGARAWGVGMPALLHLYTFGRVVRNAFGVSPMLVGSALVGKQVKPRDIDVRLVLEDEMYESIVGPLAEWGQAGTRWAAFAMAFSALGERITGLPVDFQVQPERYAARYYGEAQIDLIYEDSP